MVAGAMAAGERADGAAGAPNQVECGSHRFLWKPGRNYEEAVKTFAPYDKTREINSGARKAGAALIQEGTITPNRKTYIYVNNRLKGMRWQLSRRCWLA
jgi:hypothetical protein